MSQISYETANTPIIGFKDRETTVTSRDLQSVTFTSLNTSFRENDKVRIKNHWWYVCEKNKDWVIIRPITNDPSQYFNLQVGDRVEYFVD